MKTVGFGCLLAGEGGREGGKGGRKGREERGGGLGLADAGGDGDGDLTAGEEHAGWVMI